MLNTGRTGTDNDTEGNVDIMDVLLEILEELHGDVDFSTHERLIDDKVIDSFDIITLIAEIYDRIGTAVPAEELIPENFNSYAAMVDLITRLEDE